MIKKVLFFIAIFYLLALLQTSFFIHFRMWGFTPNIILVLVVIINVFEKPKEKAGIFAGLAGGLFLDVFSSGIIGFHILILLGLSFLIKIIFRRYAFAPVG